MTAKNEWLKWTRLALRSEIDALMAVEADLATELGEAIAQFCDFIYGQKSSRVIVLGVGKSGHIGRKIAATLSSTATPSFYLDPTEANHGDLGTVLPGDMILMLSKSGTADELLSLVPFLKERQTHISIMTMQRDAPLTQIADIKLILPDVQEACILNLAPTSSTTAMLALGDAIAVALSEARGITHESFAKSHPSGILGRKLSTKVSDVLNREKLPQPWVDENAKIIDALPVIAGANLGITMIGEPTNCLGVFTDGDLQRCLNKGLDISETPIRTVMTKDFRAVGEHTLAIDAFNLMKENNITALLIRSESSKAEDPPTGQATSTIKGVINIHQLLALNIIN